VTIDTTISTDGCCSSCKNKPERHTGLESYDAAVPQNKFKFKIGRKKNSTKILKSNFRKYVPQFFPYWHVDPENWRRTAAGAAI